MTKLTDIQVLLLSSAAQRANRNLLPLPELLAEKESEALKAIQQLIKRKLATEIEAQEKNEVYREDGERRFAALVTDAGKQAIGATDPVAEQQPRSSAVSPSPASVTSKQSKVLALLQRGQGASVPELQEATGWLPHTTRAALTGIRKRGTELIKNKVDGVTRYKAVVAQ